MDILIDITETARRLGVCTWTLRQWDKKGTLKPASRTPGNHRRYSAAEVDELVAKRPSKSYNPQQEN